MSISIATGGMFNNCCGSGVVAGGGGAPPYRLDDQKVIPTILIKNVQMINKTNDISLENIKVTLVGGGD